MKKSEMEWHSAEYKKEMAAAGVAERAGLYRVAVKTAIAACEHIDGRMQYERKYDKYLYVYETRELARISAINTVFRCAPLLLDSRSLDELERLFERCKRIIRDTSADLVGRLAIARRCMWDNHRLWVQIEQRGEVPEDELCERLGGDQGYWRVVVEKWAQMGLIRRTLHADSYVLAFSTRLGQVVPGKCPNCGKTAEAPKGMFLERIACPECKAETMFVFLAPTNEEIEE